MDQPDSGKAQRVAQIVWAFELRTTGRPPSAVSVIMNEDILVITLRGTLSPAEASLARTPNGAARLRDLHRQVFRTASEPLQKEITRITGVEVREAISEIETSTGTVVQVFLLAHTTSADSWSGSDPGHCENGLPS